MRSRDFYRFPICERCNQQGLDLWLHKNWVRKHGETVPNADLWKKILALLARHQVTFNWLRGHDGDMENERCDELARNCAARKDLPADPGYERSSGPSLFDG